MGFADGYNNGCEQIGGRRNLNRICVFCGSGLGARPEYGDAARRTGTVLAERGIVLVYGGARVGLMGLVADAALAAGGQVIGVLPDILMTRERAHAGLTELHVVRSMHERKAMMADLSDGFIALPGGMGTFEEFCEIITWGQLGLHRKPCGLLNVQGYYDPLLALVDRAITDGFIRPDQRAMVNADETIESLLDQFDTYVAPIPSLQINRSQT